MQGRHIWFGLLWSLGLVTAACYEDRPLYVASGAAGTGAGQSGAGGPVGSAGSSGAAGQGTPLIGCAAVRGILEQHNCSLAGACHDRQGSAAGLDLTWPENGDATLVWWTRLVNRFPSGGGAIASMCGGAIRPYLVGGTAPAQGLFLDKLRDTTPPCGARMPSLPPVLTSAELDCVQRFATQLTLTISDSVDPGPPPVAGDGRLVDPSSANQGFGWDTCFSKPVLTTGPRSSADPAPTRGEAYLVAGPVDVADRTVPMTDSQAFFWWMDNRPVAGLWFDYALLEGATAGASIRFYDTDISCRVQRQLGSATLSGTSVGVWHTGCVDLTAAGVFDRLGFRVDAPDGIIGIDSLRFAEACH